MKQFVKIVKEFESLTIFTKGSILDVWEGTEYASVQQIIKTHKPNKIKRNRDTCNIKVLKTPEKPSNNVLKTLGKPSNNP